VGQIDGVTQFGDATTVQANSQDGYAAGSLTSLSFNSNGEMLGFFTNGVIQTLAQVGVATFANEEGLSREGDTLFAETPNSGNPILGSANAGSAGVIRSGSLESSNVDIAREFVSLIEAQRGYQANARVISATDALLAELVNIVR
jgi:flagellar hook protein FlgE